MRGLLGINNTVVKKVNAFTAKCAGLSNILISPIKVIDPIVTRYKGIKPSEEQIVQYNAIWDTGATASVISPKVVKRNKLMPTGQTQVHTAGGEVTQNTYVIDIVLRNNLIVQDVTVTEAPLAGIDALIGMDIINQGDFNVSNYNGKTTFTFRTPSLCATDYVLESKAPARSIKIGRNEPCVCGSGKKYKNCCGK